MEITEQDMMEANTYVPLLKKEEFVKMACEKCISRIELALDGAGEGQVPMPPFYKDNHFVKARYMMGALLQFYLKKPYEPMEDGVLMAADEYDRWASSHVFSQLDRLKFKNAAVRDKVFDLQADYRDLEKRLNNEIYSLLQIQNDPCSRIMAMMFLQTTPDKLRGALGEMNALKEKIDEYQKGEERG